MEPQTPLPEETRSHANRNQQSVPAREGRDARETRRREARETPETPEVGSGDALAQAGPAAPAAAGARTGLRFARFYTTPGVDPFDAVDWEVRDALITNEKGETVFEQRGVEMPKSWSQTATNVVVSKYFRGQLGTPQRHRSARQPMRRVADTITGWGRLGGYFAAEEDAATFHAELSHVLLNHLACFNSPGWVDVGIEEKPQCSAC